MTPKKCSTDGCHAIEDDDGAGGTAGRGRGASGGGRGAGPPKKQFQCFVIFRVGGRGVW